MGGFANTVGGGGWGEPDFRCATACDPVLRRVWELGNLRTCPLRVRRHEDLRDVRLSFLFFLLKS